MIFTETPISGAFLIELEKREDDRGFFARAFCVNEFSAVGLSSQFVQVNNSLSRFKGTLRGMHYQLAPKAETKVVRCIRGSLFDVILDLSLQTPLLVGESSDLRPHLLEAMKKAALPLQRRDVRLQADEFIGDLSILREDIGVC